MTEGLLAAWDTNLVTDGDYNLRLRVALQDAASVAAIIITTEAMIAERPQDGPAAPAMSGCRDY